MILSSGRVLFILIVIFFSTLVSTLLTVFICSFVKTEGTMMSIVAIFSTAIGFLIGAYMPFGLLPAKMQWVENVCMFIPGTHGCALLRYAFMETPIKELGSYVSSLGIEGVETLVADVAGQFGYELNFFGVTVSPQWQALANAVFIVIFLALNIGVGKKVSEVLGLGKKKKKKHQ